MTNLDDLSIFISLVLRHKPEAANVKIDEHGWVEVAELIKGTKRKGYKIDMAILEQIVKIDRKKRYSFNEDKSKIRANQGHSIKVDVELKEQEPPEILYHGTATRFSGGIFSKGLIGKSRLYVHLSDNAKIAKSVGSRHGEPVVLIIDSAKMHKEGYKFYLSENGVWLCKTVPAEYISKL